MRASVRPAICQALAAGHTESGSLVECRSWSASYSPYGFGYVRGCDRCHKHLWKNGNGVAMVIVDKAGSDSHSTNGHRLWVPNSLHLV